MGQTLQDTEHGVGEAMSVEVREMRERAIYPVLIPLAAIVVVEIIVFCMSRVLLVSNKTQAAVIALAAAVGILFGAAVIANRPRISKGAIRGVLTLVLLITVGSGAWALTQQPHYEKVAEASRPEIAVAAADLAFDTDSITLAPEGTLIDFANEDSQPHNVAIYPSEDQLSEVLFQGAIINGGASANYEVPEMEVGEYYFQCDVHPTMNGEAVVEEGAGGEGAAAEH